jgi:hypothetical protein
MPCQSDYVRVPSQADRRKLALKELTAGGVKANKAISLIAISQTESSYIWNQSRAAPPALTFELSTCWQCRAVIGWEFALRGNTRILHPNNKEAVAQKFLIDNKLAAVGASGDLLPLAPLLSPNSDGIANWFEWAVKHRRADLLTNWSIGPTQMHLVWSDLFRPFQKMGPTPDRLNTWEELFDFYMAGSAAARGHAIKYLDPGSKWNALGTSWPADNPDDKPKIINWLIGQLGNKAGATQYFTNAYDRNLKAVMADARSLNLIA